MAVWLKVRLQDVSHSSLYSKEEKKERKKTEFAENTKVGNASFPVINNRLAILCQLNNIFADLIRQKAHIIEFLSGDCCRSFPCTCPAGDLSPVSHYTSGPLGFFFFLFSFLQHKPKLEGNHDLRRALSVKRVLVLQNAESAFCCGIAPQILLLLLLLHGGLGQLWQAALSIPA